MLSRWVTRSLVLVLVLLIFLSGTSLLRMKAWFFSSNQDNEEVVALRSEVASLTAKLAQLTGIQDRIPHFDSRAVLASVYSMYPFNTKQTLTVSAGVAQGVRENMAVVSTEGIFVGRVARVFEDASIVQVVFDPSFQMPVRVGLKNIDAVLYGGAAPYLDLIPKDERISVGDAVFTSGTIAPYGTPFAAISEVQNVDYESFQKAAIELPYSLNDLREVEILITYAPSH